MELHCAGMRPSAPCVLLRFGETCVLVDCAFESTRWLDASASSSPKASVFQSTIPGNNKTTDGLLGRATEATAERLQAAVIPTDLFAVDMADVDAILISSPQAMQALPFVTERTAFAGRVYATDATVPFARLLMEETMRCVTKHFVQSGYGSSWSTGRAHAATATEHFDITLPAFCASWYSLAELESCISKIHRLSFNQRVNLYNLCDIIPTSSGFGIGCCNWVIETPTERVFYMAATSLPSSQFHAQAFDMSPLHLGVASEDPLSNLPPRSIMAPGSKFDVLVVADLNPAAPLPYSDATQKVCSTIVHSLQQGGNVLLPCTPASVATLELIEAVHHTLIAANLARVPIYLVSPEANAAVAFANIMSEWLASERQEQVYLPENPFPHVEWIDSQKLHQVATVAASVRSLTTPAVPAVFLQRQCIVLASHPSLRFGDALHFLRLWGNDSRNMTILTDPSYQPEDLLQPFQPLQMAVSYIPLDRRLATSDVGSLLKNVRPDLIPSNIVLLLPGKSDQRSAIYDLTSDLEQNFHAALSPPAVHILEHGDTIRMPSTNRDCRLQVSHQLASSIIPRMTGPGVATAAVHGVLSFRDNVILLDSLPSSSARPFDATLNNRNNRIEPRAVVQRLIEVSLFVVCFSADVQHEPSRLAN
ncbi:hypothetical protein CAOG_00460 [Capsaspora owczarzaki ATCC 30864]|uniref:hypothetical protein n=1 Tax=Capsaspora owczarzaki (strain ATCC 30864) TaxID=595528 RepID=UPI00035215E2|nr:hypothetical protein CAOG_00460 [Capsaspora owczarzaki ATCC 30864]|eukprot:XP_004365331.2 hypothetical protein CAOG_00460 [Capsaspora owczarzaki ATCC 30864]